MRSLIDRLLSFLSAEFLLDYWPNGGSVVFLRALWISVLLFLASIGLYERLDPSASWRFDRTEFANATREHLHWLGVIFSASYAALYARFASQWTYLANLYNQIMSTQAQAPVDDNEERLRAYANWQAGYIEDAEDLHLVRKPLYAGVIEGMLKKPGVREAYMRHTIGGAQRLEELENLIEQVLAAERKRWEQRRNRSSARVRERHSPLQEID